MSNHRTGCYYCFRTLDPQDNNDELRAFVRCTHCATAYHAPCWKLNGKCLYCEQGIQTQPFEILRIVPLRIVTHKKALAIKPSAIVHVNKGGESETHNPIKWSQMIEHFSRRLWPVALASFLLLISVGISVFLYRLSALDEITAKAVMDAIFREPLPETRTLKAALIGGVVCAIIFYRHQPSNEWVIYFTALLVMIIGFDLVLFSLAPQDLVGFDIDLQPYHEALLAQGAAAFLMLLLLPLHRKLAPKSMSPVFSLSPSRLALYGWLRLLFVAFVIDFFVSYISTRGLSPVTNMPVLAFIPFVFFSIALTLPMSGALITGTAVASVTYWPPNFRKVKSQFVFLRLLVAVLSIFALGLMYRSTSNPEGLLSAAIVACVAMLAAIPVQRTLS